jgi:hypothetical protein
MNVVPLHVTKNKDTRHRIFVLPQQQYKGKMYQVISVALTEHHAMKAYWGVEI